MAPIDDETLDRLLSRHLGAQLDGQLGQAEAALRHGLADGTVPAQGIAPLRPTSLRLVRVDDGPFDAEGVSADSPEPILRTPLDTRRSSEEANRISVERRRFSAWEIARRGAAIAGTAVAASVATMMILPKVQPPAGPTNPTPAVVHQTPTTVVPPVRYVHDRAWDEGTVVPQGSTTPMRQIRREQIEHIRWYDERNKAWIEMTVPHQQYEYRPVEAD